MHYAPKAVRFSYYRIMAENVVQTPRGLFSCIMRRLGLERQLQAVKRYLEVNTGVLVVFLALCVLALIGLWHVLGRTSLGPILSLVRSDPALVFAFRHSFALSVMESVPGLSAAFFFVTLGFALLFIRFVVVYTEKFTDTIRAIRTSYKTK